MAETLARMRLAMPALRQGMSGAVDPPGRAWRFSPPHRLFSFITKNWRGKPLVSYQTIVQLIAATTTKAGLKVKSEIVTNAYPAGIKVSDAEMDAINIQRHQFHGDWNYTLSPSKPLSTR